MCILSVLPKSLLCASIMYRPFGIYWQNKALAILGRGTDWIVSRLLPIYYRSSSVIRQSFSLPKQSQKSRSVLYDRSRPLVLFRKDKTHIIAKFHRTDLVICNHPREGKTPSDSQINMVSYLFA